MKIILTENCPLCEGKEFMFVGKEGKTFVYCPCCNKGKIKIKEEINE